jgi:hypothetical protein
LGILGFLNTPVITRCWEFNYQHLILNIR